MNRAALSEGSPDEIAAAYAFGIVKAHIFADGNKRTALVTALTFHRLNGKSLIPSVDEGVRMMEGLAAGDVSEAGFARWPAAGLRPL